MKISNPQHVVSNSTMESSSSSKPPDFPRPAKKRKVEESTTATTVPNWVELPRDVTAKILHSAHHVCSQWGDICMDPLMWRTIDMRNFGTSHNDKYNLYTMCRHAIDRSCGHLEHIHVEFFGTDHLLNYIADSTSHLRCIQLGCCGTISDKAFNKVAKKLPLLEELDISLCYLSFDSLEAVGRCYPRLRSLKFNMKAYTNLCIECDEEAFAIAKTMPKLQYL